VAVLGHLLRPRRDLVPEGSDAEAVRVRVRVALQCVAARYSAETVMRDLVRARLDDDSVRPGE
jgi:hypothetical protein